MSNTLNRRAVKALRAPRQPTTEVTPHVIVHSTQPIPASPDGDWERTHARLTAWKAHGHLLEAGRLMREGSAHAGPGSCVAQQFVVAEEALAVAMAALEEVARLGRTLDAPLPSPPSPSPDDSSEHDGA
jgi:hypothetical protein